MSRTTRSGQVFVNAVSLAVERQGCHRSFVGNDDFVQGFGFCFEFDVAQVFFADTSTHAWESAACGHATGSSSSGHFRGRHAEVETLFGFGKTQKIDDQFEITHHGQFFDVEIAVFFGQLASPHGILERTSSWIKFFAQNLYRSVTYSFACFIHYFAVNAGNIHFGRVETRAGPGTCRRASCGNLCTNSGDQR